MISSIQLFPDNINKPKYTKRKSDKMPKEGIIYDKLRI